MAKRKATAATTKTTAASRNERVVDIGAFLKSLAEQLDDAMSKQQSEQPTHQQLKYNCYSIVVRYGREFTPVRKPKGIRWGKQKECYDNAFKLMDDDLIYCEGYAIPDLASVVLPADHAWCVDADGNVIDNTWRTPGIAYYGIPFAPRFVRKQILDTGWSAILEGDAELFRVGLPRNAVKKL